MAQLTEITLNPINSFVDNSYLQIALFDSSGKDRIVQEFIFVPQRIKPGEVKIETTIEGTLKNLVSAVNIDFPNVFNANLVKGNTVKIDVINTQLEVTHVGSFNPISNLPIFDSSIIVTPISIFDISSVVFFPTDINPCNRVGIRVTTTQTMNVFCVNYTCNQINSNTIEFYTNRGEVVNFTAGRNGVSKTRTINVPTFLNQPEIIVTNSPFGATAMVELGNTSGLDLKYSLDNVNWQSNNVFSGLDIGTYTVYVRDQLGCSKSKAFAVLENSFGYKPNVFISKENSFRFKEPNGSYLNDENQFFNQSYSNINYCFIQDFLNSDVITTQFKSNYQNVEVFVKNLDSNVVSQIPILQLTNNIGLKQKMTQVKKYKINESQFGIYFESGSIVNYDTGIAIESYNLYGSLPIWAKLGNYISINGAFYEIKAIGFDENVNSEVLIFNGIMINPIENVTAGCIYNLQDYEVYEFDLRFNEFPNSRIQIEIKNSDPNFENHTWISEEICSNETLEKYLEIRYWNSTNTNIIYSTEIQHLLRLPFNTVKAVDSDTSENYKTDTNTYLLDSKIYEITEFDFMPFPLELWRKLKIALSVDTIFIDGVGYSKNAEFTKENLGSTNLYKVTAQMSKNGFVFNSRLNSNEIIIEDPVVNIPGLINSNTNGFIGY